MFMKTVTWRHLIVFAILFTYMHTGVVEEVYAAQKIRETAMLARMKQALQERDEAVLRAKAYMKDITLVTTAIGGFRCVSCCS